MRLERILFALAASLGRSTTTGLLGIDGNVRKR
jgi:hypothetical protein